MAYWKTGLCAAVVCSACISAASAQELNLQQIQIIKDTAASICDTVKDAKGQKSDLQIETDVKAQLGGFASKFVDVGGSGRGSLTSDQFDGLSQDATAEAFRGDRECRERLFNKMFDRLTSQVPPPKQAPPIPPELQAALGHPGWMADTRQGCWVWYTDPYFPATVSWSGDCASDGQAEGRGVAAWIVAGEKQTYSGDMHAGRRNGYGVLVDVSGVHEGEWHDDSENGHQVYTDPSGNRMEGEWHNGRPIGRQVMIWKGGRHEEINY
jgi:hypothetical protein